MSHAVGFFPKEWVERFNAVGGAYVGKEEKRQYAVDYALALSDNPGAEGYSVDLHEVAHHMQKILPGP